MGRKPGTGNPASLPKARKALAEKYPPVPATHKIETLEQARSEEVLQFCLTELKKGTTYNELRLKLGLGVASHDYRWREIRTALVELLLPDSEEEAMQQDAALSGYMLNQVEAFMKRMAERAKASMGGDFEHHFFKLELESMKVLMEKYTKRTELFLKMKDIQKKEKRTRGTTIIFNNKFKVARPGDIDVTPKEAMALTSKLNKIEDK